MRRSWAGLVAAVGLVVSVPAGADPLDRLADADDAVVAASASDAAARARVAAAHAAAGDATRRLAGTVAVSDAADAAVVAAQGRLVPLGARRASDAEALGAARVRLDEAAAAAFVGAGQRDDLGALLGSGDPVELAGRHVMLTAAADARRSVVVDHAAAWEAADAAVRAAADDLAVARARASRARRAEADAAAVAAAAAWEVEAADAAAVEAAARVVAAGEAARDAWRAVLGSTVEGMPAVSLHAYQRAALWAEGVFPGCGVAWSDLAAIGRQESDHGRYGASDVAVSGRVSPPIVGIALDGTRSLPVVDTDRGVLDGDPVWDRAVGPSQFIPETWRWYARRFDLDGNGDGVEDPQNVYDGMRATAALLCRAAGRLDSDAARSRAFYAYNPSQVYNRNVLGFAAGYRAVVVVDVSAREPLR